MFVATPKVLAFLVLLIILLYFLLFSGEYVALPHILLAPAVFILLTSLEGQFITPMILGNRFSLNPLLLFLSMILWGWLWGYVGAMVAVPLLVNFKIICDSVGIPGMFLAEKR
jgi:predicted PurR-regulated permease PerM